MDEQDMKGNTMETDSRIIEAARQLVCGGEIEIREGETYEIPKYKGMYLTISESDGELPVQAVAFFTEGNCRYAVGALFK